MESNTCLWWLKFLDICEIYVGCKAKEVCSRESEAKQERKKEKIMQTQM